VIHENRQTKRKISSTVVIVPCKRVRNRIVDWDCNSME